MKKECKDHLGNVYGSKSDKCKFYNISIQVYSWRINNGWTEKDALTTPVYRGTPITYLGKTYNSLSEFCKKTGKSYHRILDRVNNGRYSIEEAISLEEEIIISPRRSVFEYEGIKYNSVADYCRKNNLSYSMVKSRLQKGYSYIEAFDPKYSKKEVLYKNIWYKDRKDFCKKNNISYSTLCTHIKKYPGLTFEEVVDNILSTTSCRPHNAKTICYSGRSYLSYTELCDELGISLATFLREFNKELSVEDAVERALAIRDGKWFFNGKHYKTLKELYNNNRSIAKVSLTTFTERVKRNNENIETALCSSNRSYRKISVYGREFNSISEVIKTFSLNPKKSRDLYYGGYSFEEIIEGNAYDKRFEVTYKGIKFPNLSACCKYFHKNPSTVFSRIRDGYSLSEAIELPRHLYIGEYRVAECLKRLNVKFYHDCSIKTVFADLDLSIDWNDFLNELQFRLGSAGYE